MKKLLFIIAVLLSFTGMAQTVGKLRYDTVKMYKIGGTTELILQNASSGVVGGVLRNVINGRTVFQTVVDTVFKNATADSFVYYIGGVRRAFKDSSGTGTYARDSIIAGRGLSATTISANKVQLDNDSSIYIVTQINDTTLSFTHYDGRIDTVTIVSSGGGGGSGWGFTGDNITAGQFLGTTNDEDLVFKRNGNEAGRIGTTNTGFGDLALDGNTGSSNASFGANTLQNNTGNFNSASGRSALSQNTTGSLNTATGAQSLQQNTTGEENTAVGLQALYENISGKRNTAIGAYADVTSGTVDSSIAIGHEAKAGLKQLAFSPHVTEIKTPGITGATTVGNVLTITSSGISKFQTPTAATLSTFRDIWGQPFNGSANITGAFTQALSANTTGITSTGYSLTGSNASSLVSLTGTLNTSGSPDIFSADFTNTASGASTNLINLKVGGVSQFKVDKIGRITTLGSISAFNISGSGFVQAAAADYLGWNGRSRFYSSSTTAIEARNSTNADYASVQSLYDRFGSGSPEGVVTAPVSAVYHRTDGSTGTLTYVKQTGSGNTGWVAQPSIVTTDSVRIGNDWFFTKKITVTSTQLLTDVTSGGVGVELVAAPGSGKAIDLISCQSNLVWNSVVYDAAPALSISYNVGTPGFIDDANTLVQTTANKFIKFYNSAALTFDTNTHLILYSNDTITTGNSNVNIYLYYRVITL